MMLKIKSWLWRRKTAFAVAASAAIVLIMLPVIASHNRMGGFDWDYFFAYHEAMRRTILIYHQFPWWNPWISGGVPLFANPQNGILSIETPFILAFGTIWGMKLAAVVYFLGGFWGMYWLLKKLKTALPIRVLLSYIWIFSTFVTFHFYAGHYTFLLYLLTPWLFFLALQLEAGWRWAIAFGLFLGFFMNSNLHYITIQALLILFFWLIGQLIVTKHKKSFLLRLAAGSALALVMIAPKLYFADKYVSQFAVPGSTLIQQTTPLRVAANAFLKPLQTDPIHGYGDLAWWEISAYAGLTTAVLFFIATAKSSYRLFKDKRLNLGFVFFLGALVCFVIGLGPFANLSPYSLLRHLPVFEAMQVPSRWFGWSILFMLLGISQLKNLRRLSIGLLSVAVVELAFINIHTMRQIFVYPPPTAVPNANFAEYESFEQLTGYGVGKTIGSDMYQSTISNYGEVNGYEPLINRATFGMHPGTCGINTGCQLTSSNAQVVYWSPNLIKLKRIAPGPIRLDVNPSSYWLVNGQRLFANQRVTEPTKKFIIYNKATNIEVKIQPL